MKIALDAAQVHARTKPTSCARRWRPSARSGNIEPLAGEDGRADGRARLRPRFRAALLRPDQGLRRIWLPRKPRGELRAPRLRVELAQVEISGGVRLRAAELAADGLLRAGPDRPRCAGAWRRGARGRCECSDWDCTEPLRSERTSALAPRPAPQARMGIASARPGRAPMSSARARPYRSVEELRTRGGVPVHAIQRLAAADAFRSMGLDRRAALWDSRALKQAPDLPLFAYAEARDEGVGSRAGAAPRDAALRACRERLPDHPPQPESAPDALPARALCGAEIRHRRPAQDDPRRQAPVDRRAGADPPAAGQRQGRGVHHPRGRDRESPTSSSGPTCSRSSARS